ncbi:DUF1573 domain-containing protein [Verrucomicrobia bacterium]|nr:DUF1573 domain-containing protein [Verrucomicrobiota bacterium]
MLHRLPSYLSLLFLLSACTAMRADLVWHETGKKAFATQETHELSMYFEYSNNGKTPVLVTSIKASCGCTRPVVSGFPWRIEPGARDRLEIKVNVRGKTGVFRKTLELMTGEDVTELVVEVNIEDPVHRPMRADERKGNLTASKSDNQAIFKGDCVACHVTPTQGKYGPSLYKAACGICHEAKHRASMVPDLKSKIKVEGGDYWRQWIEQGKPDGLMPSFAASKGGPLSDSQISTLVHYLSNPEKPAKGRKIIRSFGVSSSSKAP